MATRPSIPNRSSTNKTSVPPLQSTPTTLLSASATLTGSFPITLGANSIIQIRTHLSSTHGFLTIGEACIISERSSIGLLSPPYESSDNSLQPAVAGTTLGPAVLVESGAVVEATSVGPYTIIESGARIGKGAKVGAGCKICAGVEIGEGSVVENGMVVWGNGWGERRREGRGKAMDPLVMRKVWPGETLEVLRKGWTGK
ncbi:hypothetical protein P7C71_g2255, partial [Lecanoromycetidae sp. Uapishka_2]